MRLGGIAGFLRRYFAVLAVVLVCFWSAWMIVAYRAEEVVPGVIQLRLGHWQLEASVREAIDEMARLYSESRVEQGLAPVRVVQDAIPDTTYAQWLTTQLMGGTAPDLIQVALGSLPYHMWVQYYNRYCVPLTPYISRPNPHNRGTELEGVPLRQTFKDGMRNNYIEEMQEYISLPLSQFGVRIFYNRDLLRKLTGQEVPPGEYRAFLEVCERIKSQRDERGQPYVPIAGSRYHMGMWEWPMFDPLTYTLKDVADLNRDGFVDNAEQYVAFRTGRLSFEHPALIARHRMIREVTSHFQLGFTGLTRDEAVFLFAQQRAVFMTTGTWDARSLLEQAEGAFEVGVMDYPMPTRDDPVYGEVVHGPAYEKIGGGFPFAVTRQSRHPEVAVDFLLFMAGRRQNELLNEIIGWIPSVEGIPAPAFLRGFEPRMDGPYSCFNPAGLGGETWVKWTQEYARFLAGHQSYEELAAAFEPFYIERGYHDFMEQQKDWRRSVVHNEQFLAGIRAQALFGDERDAGTQWRRYRSILTDRQVMPEIEHGRQVHLVEHGLDETVPAPYEYGPDVLARVKENLRGRAGDQPSLNRP